MKLTLLDTPPHACGFQHWLLEGGDTNYWVVTYCGKPAITNADVSDWPEALQAITVILAHTKNTPLVYCGDGNPAGIVNDTCSTGKRTEIEEEAFPFFHTMRRDNMLTLGRFADALAYCSLFKLSLYDE